MKKISLILIIAGILIALIPVAGQIYTKYQEDRMLSEWLNSADETEAEADAPADPEEAYSQLEKVFAAEKSSEVAGAQEASAGAAASEQGQSGAQTEKAGKTSQQTVLGVIQIKKIKVKAPIVEGVKSYNLSRAVGHVPGTAAVGQPGNCAIAGHRSYTFGKFFNRLNELVTGDEIIISTKKEDLTYKVTKISVVEPDDLSVLKGGREENKITLITCTPIYIASHRLIISAELEHRVPRVP